MPGYSIITFVGEPEEESGLENISTQEQVLVYPTPATDRVRVKSPSLIERYSMFDLSGRMVQMGDVNNHEFDVQVSHLPKGVYLMRLDSRSGCVVKRVIVGK